MNHPDTSPTGWWIAGLLEKHSHSGRPPFWNNYRLIRAADWRTAFKKAVQMGQCSADAGAEALGGPINFIGITDLLPIYEEFEDGAELMSEELWPTEGAGNGIPMQIFSESDLESIFKVRTE
jgi:hypothetical protein